MSVRYNHGSDAEKHYVRDISGLLGDMLRAFRKHPDVVSLLRRRLVFPHILQDRALYRREILQLVGICMAIRGLVVVGC
jgi:hypothetical protein